MSVCLYSNLNYPARKANAPYYIVICVPSGFNIFLHIISQTMRFSKKSLLNTNYVFLFSIQTLFEIILF